MDDVPGSSHCKPSVKQTYTDTMANCCSLFCLDKKINLNKKADV